VTTSLGVTLSVRSARVKNRRAAAACRRCESSTSDDLAVLVDRPVDIAPPAVDFDVRLIHEPAIARRVRGEPGGVGQQRGEPLHPSVDRHVVDRDVPLGQ
jgi:hypothetical protein